jgi:hypothetical protein
MLIVSRLLFICGLVGISLAVHDCTHCDIYAQTPHSDKTSSPLSVGRGEPQRDRLISLALEMRQAILKGNVTRILRLIDPRGLSKADNVVPFHEVRKQLADPHSHLYGYFFDSSVLRKYVVSVNPVVSMKQFFEANQNVSVEVQFAGPRGTTQHHATVGYTGSLAEYRDSSPLLCVTRTGDHWHVYDVLTCAP